MPVDKKELMEELRSFINRERESQIYYKDGNSISQTIRGETVGYKVVKYHSKTSFTVNKFAFLHQAVNWLYPDDKVGTPLVL